MEQSIVHKEILKEFYAALKSNDGTAMHHFLLEKGITDSMLVPLHYASSWDCVEVVKVLLKHDTMLDINVRASDGCTALHFTGNKKDMCLHGCCSVTRTLM